MEVISEKAFMDSMKPAKIEALEDGLPAYISDDDVLGFDFSNLAPGRDGVGALDFLNAGERRVETAMASALFEIAGKLGLFPVFLMAVDDEWVDEEQRANLKEGSLSEEEAELMDRILEKGGNMKVLMLKKEEIEDAAAIVTPQMTLLSNRVAAMDSKGKFLAYFSEDDEVSFNTTDPDIYKAARKLALEMRAAAPFEMIFAEDYA